jgi:hypothetical protein
MYGRRFASAQQMLSRLPQRLAARVRRTLQSSPAGAEQVPPGVTDDPSAPACGSAQEWDAPRVVVLTTADHAYTLKDLLERPQGLRLAQLSYEEAFQRPRLSRAVHVFTDVDRLSPPDRRQAAQLFRQLQDQGVAVLNDPARVPSRFGLLRMLHNAGINSFNAYRIEEGRSPERWPVFLRVEGSHGYPSSGLLEDASALEMAIAAALEEGHPSCDLLMVEYCAEPLHDTLFRKLASFRMGDRGFAHACVHENSWLVKYGTLGIATEADYEDDLRIVRDDPHGEVVRRAFELAGISYGRADFGLVNGRVEIYEINTNPSLGLPSDHPSAVRRNALGLFEQNLRSGLLDLSLMSQEGAVEISADDIRRWFT